MFLMGRCYGRYVYFFLWNSSVKSEDILVRLLLYKIHRQNYIYLFVYYCLVSMATVTQKIGLKKVFCVQFNNV